MSFRSGIKKIKNICWKAREILICQITRFSPKLNTMIRYRMAYGSFPNLRNPKTFSEKLCWLKLYRYMKNPLVIQCADKFRVRDYVSDKGCGNLLNTLYDVCDSPERIAWDLFPNEFVLKWNFGAGKNLVCRNKSEYSVDQVKQLFHQWGKDRCWLSYSELQYKYITPQIICERYLQDDIYPNALPDYKVYCFNGEPLAILVILDRDSVIKAEFFDTDWQVINNPKYPKPEKDVERPECLQQMLDSAKLLCKPFPFVRVDFYVVNGKLFFGELTFTPAGGLYMSQTDIHGKDMAEYLDINYNQAL